MSTDTLDPDTFDIIAYLEGSNYPETVVTVYTDGKAALALRDALAEEEEDQERITKLRSLIDQSALKFTLRGLAPKVVEVMMKKNEVNSKSLTEEERFERFLASTDALTAATIVKVETADGKVDNRPWDVERAVALRGALISSEYGKLSEGVATVNFDAELFSEAVDAGFPS